MTKKTMENDNQSKFNNPDKAWDAWGGLTDYSIVKDLFDAMGEKGVKKLQKNIERWLNESITSTETHIKTDVLLDAKDFPFLTFTESKVPNIWYHEQFDELFTYTSRGFRKTQGSKKVLKEKGLLRE